MEGPVVGTVMSNLGLEHALAAQDIDFRRASVGDRYVLEALREHGGIIGGETSGHMLVLDKTTTGDGLISALQVLAIMKETGKRLSELVAGCPGIRRPWSMCAPTRRLNPDTSPASRMRWRVAEGELGGQGAGCAAGIGHRARDSGHGRGRRRGEQVVVAREASGRRLSRKPLPEQLDNRVDLRGFAPVSLRAF